MSLRPIFVLLFGATFALPSAAINTGIPDGGPPVGNRLQRAPPP